MYGFLGVIMYELILKLVDELGKVMLGNLDCFFFGNSGIEVIEGVLKLVRYVIKCLYVIFFLGCFYGCLMGVLSVIILKSKYR